jgi:hypothetical protein
LFKQGRREVFLYKARRLYPLPFHDTYVVFRDVDLEIHGYRNIYLNVKTGAIHQLKGVVVQDGDAVSVIGEFMFSMPSYWRLRIFKWRMRRLMAEDNVLIRERVELGGSSSPACAPAIPESYDLFLDTYKEFAADTRFLEDFSVADLQVAR